MKPAAPLATLCAIAALALLACTATAAAGAPPLGSGAGASRQAWAAAAGLSRGIGLGAPLDVQDGRSAMAQASFCRHAARAGFRSVHLPVRLAAPPAAAALERLDRLLDGCLALNLSVVLELDEPPAPPRRGPPPLLRHWHLLAARHAARPPRLLYQVSAHGSGPPSAGQAPFAPALAAIRAHDATRVVVVAGADAVALPKFALPADPHLIVAIGHHEPQDFTRQGEPGRAAAAAAPGTGCCTPQEAQLMALPLDLARRWSRERRYPVWVTGFQSPGAAPPQARARHARLLREAAESRGLPWCYGDFDGGFGAYDRAARRWQPDLLQALTGP